MPPSDIGRHDNGMTDPFDMGRPRRNLSQFAGADVFVVDIIDLEARHDDFFGLFLSSNDLDGIAVRIGETHDLLPPGASKSSIPDAPSSLVAFSRSSMLFVRNPRPMNLGSPRCVMWITGSVPVPRMNSLSLVRSTLTIPKSVRNSSATSRSGDCSRPNVMSATLIMLFPSAEPRFLSSICYNDIVAVAFVKTLDQFRTAGQHSPLIDITFISDLTCVNLRRFRHQEYSRIRVSYRDCRYYESQGTFEYDREPGR